MTVSCFFFRPSKGEVAKAHIRNILSLRPLVLDRMRYECRLFARIQTLNSQIKEMSADAEAVGKGKHRDPSMVMQLADRQMKAALTLSTLLNLYDESIVLTTGWTRLLEVSRLSSTKVSHRYSVF